MQSFHNLRVINRIRELIAIVYRITARLSYDERFGLVVQMRRAAISIGGMETAEEPWMRDSPADQS